MKVGQEVFVVYGNRYGKREPRTSHETVTKVGRKWASFGFNSRFDIETGQLDGGGYSSPGRAYIDEAEWQIDRNRDATWTEIYKLLSHSCPKHLTIEKLREIAAALKA